MGLSAQFLMDSMMIKTKQITLKLFNRYTMVCLKSIVKCYPNYHYFYLVCNGKYVR